MRFCNVRNGQQKIQMWMLVWLLKIWPVWSEIRRDIHVLACEEAMNNPLNLSLLLLTTLSCVFYVALANEEAVEKSSPIVKTKYGPIRGVVTPTGHFEFRGIP